MVDALVTPAPSRYPVIRPELLPRPDVLEWIDYEANLAARLALVVERWTIADPPAAANYDVQNLEFDPIKIVEEVGATFDMYVRDRVNQAARAVMTAFAIGSDLDAIGSNYPYGMPRLVTDGVRETDDAYRRRMWLSPDLLNPRGGVAEAYAFHALSSLGANVIRDASAFTKRQTGIVYIPVMMNFPTPTPTRAAIDAQITAAFKSGLVNPLVVVFPIVSSSPVPTSAQILDVYRYVIADTRKNLTDEIVILAPKVSHSVIRITVWSFPGYDPAIVLGNITEQLFAMIEKQRWLGYDLTIMGIDGILAQQGVYNRRIEEPTSDVIVGQDGTVQITGIELRYVGIGE